MAEFREIITQIRKKIFAPVYILMGAEPYYIDRITGALEEAVVEREDKEFDQSTLYGSDANAAMVMEAAGQYPMMSPLRYVVLKEAQSLTRAKAELDKLKPYILKPNPKTVLCVAFKGDTLNATSEILKAAKKNKDVIVFDSPKIREYKLGEVIKDYCLQIKVTVEEKAVEYLIANVGSSLSSLFSEIEKLKVSLPAESNRITAELVSEHTGISKEFNNFELVNALARRDYFQSLKILHYFEENPKANPTVVTASQIFTFFQRLLLASFNADKSDNGLLAALQLKSPYVLREIRVGLQNYNASQLVNVIHAIRDFDTKSKGIGSFQKEYALLEELILRILTIQ